ncbi:MAG: hypothetical protein WD467_00360 [Candidatus Saccharimonadales bacterium]
MDSIYQKALRVTSDYLGPAADRFLRRQISFHLEKEPEHLTPADVPLLAEWVKVSIAILTEDKQMVDEFGKRFKALVE